MATVHRRATSRPLSRSIELLEPLCGVARQTYRSRLSACFGPRSNAHDSGILLRDINETLTGDTTRPLRNYSSAINIGLMTGSSSVDHPTSDTAGEARFCPVNSRKACSDLESSTTARRTRLGVIGLSSATSVVRARDAVSTLAAGTMYSRIAEQFKFCRYRLIEVDVRRPFGDGIHSS
jgi:hypothetical protein